MAPVSGPRYQDRNELTGEGIVNIISYLPSSQKTCWHNARICLGENRTLTLNRLDLCYSFKTLCHVEYGGTCQLHIAVKNYERNYPLSAGHWTLMVHQCLNVAAALGHYHRWQHRVSPQEKSENVDWNRIPLVYRDKGTPPKKGGGSSYTVTKLPSSLEPKGQRPLSLPHSP